MNNFYSDEELRNLKFKSCGKNVLISKKCSIHGADKISLGSNIRIDDFAILSGNISIGNYSHVGVYSSLFAGEQGIKIGNFVSISSNCTIWGKSDDYTGEYLANPTIPNKYKNVIDKYTEIQDLAMIGSGTTILPGAKIQEGTSIGAMSLVNKPTKPWCLYIGSPIKFVKQKSTNAKKLMEEVLKEEKEI